MGVAGARRGRVTVRARVKLTGVRDRPKVGQLGFFGCPPSRARSEKVDGLFISSECNPSGVGVGDQIAARIVGDGNTGKGATGAANLSKKVDETVVCWP